MFTHVHNQKVQPAPVVGKIFLEAVSNPLEEHFQHKDVGENFVSIFQDHFDDFSPLDVDIFKCLQKNTKSVNFRFYILIEIIKEKKLL